MSNLIDLTDMRFGRLVVIKYAPYITNGKKRYKWKCICDCGKETSVDGKSLRSGETKSCGCLNSKLAAERRLIDISGLKFGRLLVLTNLGSQSWKCVCECGNETVIDKCNLITGHTKSCGCLRSEMTLQRNIDIGFGVSKVELLLGDYIENEYQIKIDRSFSIEDKLYDIRYKNLLIESDGGYWHTTPTAIKNDKYKNELAIKHGFTLLRFGLNSEKEVSKKWNEIKKILDQYFVKGNPNELHDKI